LVDETDVTGIGGGIRSFFFFSAQKNSFYISPFFRVAQIGSTNDLSTNTKFSDIGYAGGLTLGYEWNFDSQFTLKLGLGLEHWQYQIKSNQGTAGHLAQFSQVDIIVGYRL